MGCCIEPDTSQATTHPGFGSETEQVGGAVGQGGFQGVEHCRYGVGGVQAQGGQGFGEQSVFQQLHLAVGGQKAEEQLPGAAEAAVSS